MPQELPVSASLHQIRHDPNNMHWCSGHLCCLPSSGSAGRAYSLAVTPCSVSPLLRWPSPHPGPSSWHSSSSLASIRYRASCPGLCWVRLLQFCDTVAFNKQGLHLFTGPMIPLQAQRSWLVFQEFSSPICAWIMPMCLVPYCCQPLATSFESGGICLCSWLCPAWHTYPSGGKFDSEPCQLHRVYF